MNTLRVDPDDDARVSSTAMAARYLIRRNISGLRFFVCPQHTPVVNLRLLVRPFASRWITPIDFSRCTGFLDDITYELIALPRVTAEGPFLLVVGPIGAVLILVGGWIRGVI